MFPFFAALSALTPPAVLPIAHHDSDLSSLKGPAVTRKLEPIKVLRNFTGAEAKQRMFGWYQLVKSQGYTWRSKPSEVNIVFIRGCDLDFKINTKGYDHFNDLMVVAGKKADGSHFVREIRCTTKPGWRKSGGRKNLGRVIPGQYFYNGQPGNHCGEFGALRLAPWQQLFGVRDANGDGIWSAEESKHLTPITDVNIHWVQGTNNRQNVEGWSEGCFVLPLTHLEFLQNVTPLFQYNKTETIPVSLIDASNAGVRLGRLKDQLEKKVVSPQQEAMIVRQGSNPEGWFLARQTIKLARL